MPRPVLIAASPRIAHKIVAAIGDAFAVQVVSDPDKATALATTGCFLAVVKAGTFPEVGGNAPTVRVGDTLAGSNMLEELAAIRERARLDQRARASELAYLAALSYDEYIDVARARATRDYLLALLLRHRGVVMEAARAAGLLRETMHRLIRRHDIDPAWFRDDHE